MTCSKVKSIWNSNDLVSTLKYQRDVDELRQYFSLFVLASLTKRDYIRASGKETTYWHFYLEHDNIQDGNECNLVQLQGENCAKCGNFINITNIPHLSCICGFNNSLYNWGIFKSIDYTDPHPYPHPYTTEIKFYCEINKLFVAEKNSCLLPSYWYVMRRVISQITAQYFLFTGEYRTYYWGGKILNNSYCNSNIDINNVYKFIQINRYDFIHSLEGKIRSFNYSTNFPIKLGLDNIDHLGALFTGSGGNFWFKITKYIMTFL